MKLLRSLLYLILVLIISTCSSLGSTFAKATTTSADTFTYLNNAQVSGDWFYVRDANGNIIPGRQVDDGDIITVLNVDYTKQLVYVEYPTTSGVSSGYISNVPSLIRYDYQGQWENGATTLEVFDENGQHLGWLDPYETATPLYMKNGMMNVVYNTDKGTNTKSGYVKYFGGFIGFNPINSATRINNLLNVASNEIGYIASDPNGNYTKYGQWFGWDGVPWCHIFLSWVAAHSGCENIIPRTASCSDGVQWFKNNGLFGTTPKVGAIIYFGTNGSEHVGIVESVNSDDTITTIEGNYHYVNGTIDDWRVWRGNYSINNSDIYGYGYPNY